MVLLGPSGANILVLVFGQGGVFCYNAPRTVGTLVVVARGTSVIVSTHGRKGRCMLNVEDILVLVRRGVFGLLLVGLRRVQVTFGRTRNIGGGVVGVRNIKFWGLFLVGLVTVNGTDLSRVILDRLFVFLVVGGTILDETSFKGGKFIIRGFVQCFGHLLTVLRRSFLVVHIVGHRIENMTRPINGSSWGPYTTKVRNMDPGVVDLETSYVCGPFTSFAYHFVYRYSYGRLPQHYGPTTSGVLRPICRRNNFSKTYAHGGRGQALNLVGDLLLRYVWDRVFLSF